MFWATGEIPLMSPEYDHPTHLNVVAKLQFTLIALICCQISLKLKGNHHLVSTHQINERQRLVLVKVMKGKGAAEME